MAEVAKEGNACIAAETDSEERERVRYRFEDGGSCSLANAFELRSGYTGILSCSEWP